MEAVEETVNTMQAIDCIGTQGEHREERSLQQQGAMENGKNLWHAQSIIE
jgi:hypothetical protein